MSDLDLKEVNELESNADINRSLEELKNVNMNIEY